MGLVFWVLLLEIAWEGWEIDMNKVITMQEEEKTITDDGISEKGPCSDHQSAEVWEGWEIDMNNGDMTGMPQTNVMEIFTKHV